jgi:membrane fusion protein (multidrug efflux system)
MTATACRRPPHALLALTVALAGLGPGCQKVESPEEEEHAAPTKWEHPEKGVLQEWADLLGTTQTLPNRLARVSAGIEGQVLEVLPGEGAKAVAEGQQVHAGQVLVRLDDHVVRANRDKLLAAENELEELARQAGLAVELARIEVERLDNLESGGRVAGLVPVSKVEREKARVTLLEAQSKQKAALAHQEAARAERKALEEQLSLFTLRAPIAGRLGLVHAVPGQTLAVGTVVAEVVDLDEIDVLCFVPASTVARLRLGQEARVGRAGESDEEGTTAGKVAYIGAQAQAETGTVAVKARFPNRDLGLRANTLRQVRVLTGSKEARFTLPEAALLEDQDPPAVLVAVPEKNDKGEEVHKAHKYVAVVGLRDRAKHRVELVGLRDPETRKDVPIDEHMEFITEGGHGLEDGDLVKEEEEEHKDGEHKDDEHKDDGHKKDEHKDGKEDPKGGK